MLWVKPYPGVVARFRSTQAVAGTVQTTAVITVITAKSPDLIRRIATRDLPTATAANRDAVGLA